MVELDFNMTTDDDIKFVADNMRDFDVAEVLAAGSESVHQSLVDSVELSKTAVAVSHDGVTILIFGLVKPSLISKSGVIWMLGANQSLNYKRELMVYTRRVIKEMLNECDELYNYVHDENKVSIKWLKALGFTMGEPEPYGPYDALFRRFYMKKDADHV